MPAREAVFFRGHTLVDLLDPQPPLTLGALLLLEDIEVVRFNESFVDLEVILIAQHEAQCSVTPSLSRCGGRGNPPRQAVGKSLP